MRKYLRRWTVTQATGKSEQPSKIARRPRLRLTSERFDIHECPSDYGTHRPRFNERSIILSEVRSQSFLIYLDDVIVFSRTAEDHLRHVDEILTLLRKLQRYAGERQRNVEAEEMIILPTASRLSRTRYNARKAICHYGKHEIVHARNVPEKHDATTFVPRTHKRISTIRSPVLRYRTTT